MSNKTDTPTTAHHCPGVEGLGNRKHATDSGIAWCAQSLSDPSHQSFRHVRATRSGTGAGRLRCNLRDRTTKLMLSTFAIRPTASCYSFTKESLRLPYTHRFGFRAFKML